jgi:hypothetical protein
MDYDGVWYRPSQDFRPSVWIGIGSAGRHERIAAKRPSNAQESLFDGLVFAGRCHLYLTKALRIDGPSSQIEQVSKGHYGVGVRK